MATFGVGRRLIRRVAVPVLGACIVLLATAGSAVAFWASAGSGSGTAATGTLDPPVAVSGVQTAGSGDVTVSWSAGGGTLHASGYYVLRIDSSSSTSPACGSDATHLITATACTDSAVPLGSYRYTVVGVFRSWTATSDPSPAVAVAQASQTITFGSLAGHTYGDSDFSISATASSGLAVTFSSTATSTCTVSGSTVHLVGAGSCTINADQAGSTYFAPAPTVTRSFTVAKAAQTITFTSTSPADATVGGPSYTVAATGGASGNPVLFSSATTGVCTSSATNGATISFVGAGTCTINAIQAGSADYGAGSATQTFPVSAMLNGTALCFVSLSTSGCATSPLVVGQGNGFAGTVRLLDSAGNPINSNVTITVSLSASNDLGAPSPATVVIAAGSSSSGTFAATLTSNGRGKSGTLTAQAQGHPLSATLIINSN